MRSVTCLVRLVDPHAGSELRFIIKLDDSHLSDSLQLLLRVDLADKQTSAFRRIRKLNLN